MSARYTGVIISEHVVMSNVKYLENRYGRKHKGSSKEWKSELGKTISKVQLKSETDEDV